MNDVDDVDDIAPAAVGAQYLHRHVDPRSVDRIWRHGRATVLLPQVKPDDDGPGLTCLGETDDLRVALRACSDQLTAPPVRLSVNSDATAALPAGWCVPEWTGWVAFSIDHVPEIAGIDRVVPLPLDRWAGEIADLLDVASPRAWGRPGRDSSAWWGIVDPTRRRLESVGAVRTDLRPSAHLSGIATHPAARGRGHGGAVTAALTRAGLAAGLPFVTLDAYADNTAALRMYERLGYALDARFRSGVLDPPESLSGS